MIWKQHPILTEYEVSDAGEVRRGTHVLKSHIKGGHYRVIRLRHNGAYVTKYVHRLVLEHLLEWVMVILSVCTSMGDCTESTAQTTCGGALSLRYLDQAQH